MKILIWTAIFIVAAIAGVASWYVDNNEEAAATMPPVVVDIQSPSLSPEIKPENKPTPTSSSIPANTVRINYVRDQLALSAISSASFNSLLADKRLVIYPVKTVAYKEPDWSIIRNKLYSPTLVQKGKDYINIHRAIFEKAEKDFGIPKEALTGLIAMETDFGANSGSYPTFNVLYSRMLRWPETRWKAQADQLMALTKYCAKSNTDCHSIKGSYAGAIGIVQFMPNSLLAYGIDGNGDGHIDLSTEVDAIPSAANYLKLHGWEQDQHKALARYYGSAIGYPEIILAYAELLRQK